ncbi:MAG: DUF4827 domain-containing protein [Prevotella sp.]|nr:DUF4827 domain-containing protein [Prevotella sp.]
MKQTKYILLLLMSIVLLTSCERTQTYAEQKKRERSAINQYIADAGIKVISESQFYAQDSLTDVSKNEFVLFSGSGVYMQIIRKGCGARLKKGETAHVLCRFTEYNLLVGADSIHLTNNVLYYSSIVDKMSVRNTSGTFTASFESGLMYTTYGTASVPSGWLVPLSYINLGRHSAPGEEIAKVKLIVPHSQGQSNASQNVYPCLYDITYERGI